MSLIGKVKNFEAVCRDEVRDTLLLGDLEKLTHTLGLNELKDLTEQHQMAQSFLLITRKIIETPKLSKNDKIVALWEKVLQEGHGAHIYRHKAPNLVLDTSVALEMLKTKQLPTIHYEKVDLGRPEALEEALKLHFEFLEEFFPKNGFCFPRRFIRQILTYGEADCYVARIGKECVALFWGHHYQNKTSSQFYVHGLGCKGSVATLGVGNKISELAFKDLFEEKKIEYITLDAYKNNEQALRFYERKHQFIRLSETLNEDLQYTLAKSAPNVTSALPTDIEVEDGAGVVVGKCLRKALLQLPLIFAEMKYSMWRWSVFYESGLHTWVRPLFATGALVQKRFQDLKSASFLQYWPTYRSQAFNKSESNASHV